MEPLSIIITTYNRLHTATQTLLSLKENLKYGNRVWIIADDGSPDGYVDQLTSLIDTQERVIVTNANRRGVGVSKNLALKQAFLVSPVVFMTEDDWALVEPLNVDPYVDTLLTQPSVGIIRCGYLSTDMKASFVGYSSMTYLKLEQGSGVYVYSGQCSFRHERFYNSVGYHQEGVSPGEEELEMCKRYNDTHNAPEILWPGNMPFHFQCSPFKNVGMDYSLNSVAPDVG